MNQIIPGSAFILPPPRSENNGVDFLGLRQANLDMMADLIPGTNNVTPYLRPFALLGWIFWKFHELCERRGKLSPTNLEARAFRERIEVLFTWGARLADAPRIPGKQAVPPKAKAGYVDLTFEAWNRVQSSTSLIAALWYGPASKTTTGLGLLDPVGPDFYRTIGLGVALARSLDKVLRTNSDLYTRLLDTLATIQAQEADAVALWGLWGVTSTTGEERISFRAALYQESAVGDYAGSLGKRSSTLALACAQLRSGVPQSSDAVRRSMYYAENGCPEALRTARMKWIVLQMRQLQRLAFESLLSWCEHKTLTDVHDTSTMTVDIETAFDASEYDLPVSSDISAMLAALDGRASDIESFAALGRSHALSCPFQLIELLQSQFRSMGDKIAATCIYSIILCASFAGYFGEQQRSAIMIGGQNRLSLYHLRKRLLALGNASVRQAIQFILEALVVSQHLSTAVNRFDGQNQRLRLSIEESGLESLVGQPWGPTVTEDRLPTILRLAADCGVIAAVSEDTFVSLS
jgi:hypothetical protein